MSDAKSKLKNGLSEQDTAEQLVQILIDERKISQPGWWMSQKGRVGIFIVVLFICILISGLYQWFYASRMSGPNIPNSAQLASALITAAAAFFVFNQWADARREASLDKFYDRLKLVNERYYDWKEARDLVSQFFCQDEATFRKHMYVFLELDNLEYMLIRYELGYVRKPLLRRAVRTFSSRCRSNEFCLIASLLVRGSGYNEKTKQVTDLLVKQAQQSSSKSP